jgi:hypothetical protein
MEMVKNFISIDNNTEGLPKTLRSADISQILQSEFKVNATYLLHMTGMNQTEIVLTIINPLKTKRIGFI